MTTTHTTKPVPHGSNIDDQMHSTIATLRGLPALPLRRRATFFDDEAQMEMDRLTTRAARLILAGAIPTDSEFDMLLETIHKRIPSTTAPVFLWQTFRHTKDPVPNRFTCKLADIMAAGTDNDKTIWDAMGNTSRIELSIPRFAKTFGVNYLRAFIDNLTKRRILCPQHFYEAAKQFLTNDDIRRLRPCSVEDLIWVAKTLDGHMGEEFGEMLHAACRNINDSHEKHLEAMFDALQEEHLRYIGTHWRKAFPPLTIEICKSIAACPQVPGDLLNAAIKHLAQARGQHEITLGRPYAIPRTLTGKILAQVLIYLEQSLRNPRGMITDLPSQEQLRTRMIELQVANKPGTELLTAAIEARDRLQKTTAEGNHACNRLAGLLIKQTADPDSLEQFVQKIMQSPLKAADATILLTCLFDVVAYRKSLYNGDEPVLYMQENRFDYISWTSKPSEKTSTRLHQMIMKIEKKPHNQARSDHT